MSKTIERVAEAMAIRAGTFHQDGWSALDAHIRDRFMEDSRSALLALEGAVSDEMVEAGARAMCRLGCLGDPGEMFVDANWRRYEKDARAAIQAALKAAGE